ncbi:unnamed protein product, partial [marine sediment metagenome]
GYHLLQRLGVGMDFKPLKAEPGDRQRIDEVLVALRKYGA